MFRFSVLIFAALFASCTNNTDPHHFSEPGQPGAGAVVAEVNLPAGFEIREFADVPNARSMVLSPKGTLFVGNRDQGSVYAVVDRNHDFLADTVYQITSGMNMPNGVAFKNGDLYVAEVNRILRYRNIENDLANPPEPEVIADDFPTDRHHGWKYIAFGPDGKLYVPVGAPCNVCERTDNPIYASITRMNDDGSDREIIAHGVRNTVGFTWHPTTDALYFTDNNRDMMGDDIPPCELNRLDQPGQHFGFPYLHGKDVPDPEFHAYGVGRTFTEPVQELGPHTAPLGMLFYNGNQFPAEYRHQALIAEHGSWNRSKKIGYRLTMITFENGKAVDYKPFADGWLNDTDDSVTGRPVDIIELPDGSLLVSDDYAGKIYRIAYIGETSELLN